MSDEVGGRDAPRIDAMTYDEAVADLTRTVAELEAGGLPLERSLALYERGVALHERCAELLGQAELRVQRLLDRASGALEIVEVKPGESGEE